MNLWWNLLAVGTGFAAGAAFMGVYRDKLLDSVLNQLDYVYIENSDLLAAALEDSISFEDYDSLLEISNDQSYVIYAIDMKAEEYATRKHTVYRKVARELNDILYPEATADDA